MKRLAHTRRAEFSLTLRARRATLWAIQPAIAAMQSSPLRVDVIFQNGETFTLSGRVARLVLWLCRNAARIGSQPKGEISIRYGEGPISCRVTDVWDSI